jgi:hypothetical protein
MTSTTHDLLSVATDVATLDLRALAAAVDALEEVERVSTICAAEMVAGHHDVCDAVRADLDAVDVTHATRLVLTRGGDAALTRPLLEAAVLACERSGAECERHARHYPHCRICARVSRRAVEACRALLAVLDA